MKTYGLIGYPLEHSFSPAFFNAKFKAESIAAEYKLFPLKKLEEFFAFLERNPNISGLNVTIPYKQSIISYLDSISPEAEKIGAVNTIVFKKGKTIGHNTDVFGFEESLIELPNLDLKALVFGTGGASKAVQFVLEKRQIPFQLIGRKEEANVLKYSDVSSEMATSNLLWINCTPVGTFPAVDTCLPLPFSALTKEHYFIDLVYNPAQTKNMKMAQKFNATAINGLKMLHMQALKAWQLWQA